MESIKDTVGRLIKTWQSKATADNPQLWLREVFNKQQQKHTCFSYFKKGILGIKVDSSAWSYQLNLEKARLLESLRQRSSSEIKDLRFSVGNIEEKAHEKENNKKRYPSARPKAGRARKE
ncbi:MAG: DUF721 domain-containing protein [Candidatus Omnitrophica bacterium]|nr:DUF721 domain-containing protein [Candidatus Omnitrophota bacterium]